MDIDLHLIVLGMSVALQFVAFFIAVYALRFAGFRSICLIFAAVTLLIGINRGIAFVNALNESTATGGDLTTELLALLVSALLAAGLGLSFPAVKKLSRRLLRYKSALSDLRENELKYQAVLKSSGTGFALVDRYGCVIECNEEYVYITGRTSSEELIGHNVAEWYETDLGPDYAQQEFAKVGPGDSKEYFKGQFRHPDGSFVPVDMSTYAYEIDGQLRVMVMASDISKRVADEKIAKREEEQYRILFENTDTGFILFDRDGVVLDCNQAFTRIIARDKSKEIIGSNLDDWVRHSDADYVGKVLAEIVENQSEEHFGLGLLRPDGTIVPIEVFTYALVNRTDKAVMALVRDISEREIARKELEASEQRTSQLFERSPISIGIYSVDGHMLATNMAHKKLFGISVAELSADYTTLEDQQLIDGFGREKLALLVKGEPVDLPPLKYRADLNRPGASGERTIKVQSFPLYNATGDVESVVQLHIDLTEQTQSEQQIRRDESRFRALVDTTYTGYIRLTTDGYLLEANNEYARLAGYANPEVMVGEHFSNWVKADSLDKANVLVANLPDAPGMAPVTMEFIHKDGTIIPVEVHAATIGNEEGTEFVCFVRNISERLQSEERSRRAQKMDAIGKLTGGVAHDFNNLLAVILGNTELALNKANGSGDIPRYLSSIKIAAKRGAELTSRLLAFSRQAPLSPKLINLDEALDNAAALLTRLIGEDIEIQFISAEETLKCEVDPGELENVIVNLANNARDAMPDGGVLKIDTSRVYCDEDNPLVVSEELVAGEYIALSVADTGCGIDPDIIGKVTDPFFTTKDPDKGTGLGLSMAYGFARQSKGCLDISSQHGEGTTVTIYLPSRSGEAESLTDKKSVSTIPGGGEKILLVEDDPALGVLIGRVLEPLGYRTEHVVDVSSALEIFHLQGDFDMVLTDIVLPGGRNGRELIAELRSSHPELKVIYMSGYSENALISQGRLEEGVTLLQKPFKNEDLGNKVREVLDS